MYVYPKHNITSKLTLLLLSIFSLQEGLRSCATVGSSLSRVMTVGAAVVIVAVTLTPLEESPLAPDC
jgi:hypothetical protein